MSSDVNVNNEYPAVEYQPTEAGGAWHEDREVTLSGGPGSQMVRTYNATFNKLTASWGFPSGASAPAYATIQNPDGSLHYFTNPTGATSWTTWAGSGNNTVYNAVDYGMLPSNSTTANQTALQAAVSAAFDNGGGVVSIPSGVYQIEGTTSIDFGGVPGTDYGIIIAGVSGTTELVQNNITDNTFSFSGLRSGRGVRFRDLRITYVVPEVSPPSTGIAIYVTNCQNISCEHVYFNNCPQALYLDNQSLQCGLVDCTLQYNNNINGMSMIYLGGSENYIDSCHIMQQPIGGMPAGPTGCTGIIVQPGGGLICITNTHLSDFTTGILVYGGGSNLTRLFGSNIICESWTNAVIIQPTNSSNTIYDVFFDDCIFSLATSSTETAAVGILIDTKGGVNSHVANVFLNNCLVYGWSGPGVQVNAGENIVITGGRYGSNATSMTTSGGIAVTGTAANVTIDAADCTPTVLGLGAQPYGISISAAVAGLFVRGCNLTGYGSGGPVYTSSAGTQIQITDCAGYSVPQEHGGQGQCELTRCA